MLLAEAGSIGTSFQRMVAAAAPPADAGARVSLIDSMSRVPGAIRALTSAIAECNTTFERRKEVLLS